jgi:hypothetical protein
MGLLNLPLIKHIRIPAIIAPWTVLGVSDPILSKLPLLTLFTRYQCEHAFTFGRFSG